MRIDPRFLPPAASWPAGEAAPVLEIKSLFSTRRRPIRLTKPGKVNPLDAAG